MREIEFRGMDALGVWIYGSLDLTRDRPEIVEEEGCRNSVQSETVGQYTGMKDDNGVKIYEGDVVDVVPILGIHFRGVVKFNSHTSAFDVFREERGDSACLKDDFSVEVRGNIFDNPELDKQFGELYRKEQ